MMVLPLAIILVYISVPADMVNALLGIILYLILRIPIGSYNKDVQYGYFKNE